MRLAIVVVESVVFPITVRLLLKIASPLKILSPLSVVLESVTFVPDVKVPPVEPPEDVLLVTAKNEPPEDPSLPLVPSLPSFPAGPGTFTYLVIYVTVDVEM